MIETIIIIFTWGAVGGFDWAIDCYDLWAFSYESVIEDLLKQNNNYVKTLMYKDNIIDNKIACIQMLENEIIGLNKIIEFQKQNIDTMSHIMLELENLDPLNDDNVDILLSNK